MITTLTHQGKLRWLIINETFDADKFIEFLQAYSRMQTQKSF
jgi:hypothetical protein